MVKMSRRHRYLHSGFYTQVLLEHTPRICKLGIDPTLEKKIIVRMENVQTRDTK